MFRFVFYLQFMYRPLLVVQLCLFSSFVASAQKNFSGKIYLKNTDSTLSGIYVFNSGRNINTISDKEGKYSIGANEGDEIIFSGLNIKTDTVTLTFDMIITQYHVELEQKYVTLEPVSISHSYRVDSLNRRNDYRRIFENTPNITGGNRPTNGVGISFSFFSYFSSKAKAQRKLKKRLLKEEQETYIDYLFSINWVASLTGLKDDSLHMFYYRYRPSYIFCKATDKHSMVVYISDSLKEFRNPKK
jgi:hypothetical protein